MIDDAYKNAFKEVYDILENTDEELLKKIPVRFMFFIKENMNMNYETNIQKNVEIDMQKLLPETESILSLIYRSYWSTDEEKKEFAEKDKQYFTEKAKIQTVNSETIANKSTIKTNQDIVTNKIYENTSTNRTIKNIYEVFEERKNLKKITLDNNLVVIKKENFIQKLFRKIFSIFK